jgi:hypothetical protein
LESFESSGVDEITLAPTMGNDPALLEEAMTLLGGVLLGPG